MDTIQSGPYTVRTISHKNARISSLWYLNCAPISIIYLLRGATVFTWNVKKLECGPMPNVMVALPNIGGGTCSTPQSLAHTHYYTVFRKKHSLLFSITSNQINHFTQKFQHL